MLFVFAVKYVLSGLRQLKAERCSAFLLEKMLVFLIIYRSNRLTIIIKYVNINMEKYEINIKF